MSETNVPGDPVEAVEPAAVLYPAMADLRGRVGVVVPTWYAAEVPALQARALLWTTLAGSPACLEPADVVVVVDGSPAAQAAAESLRERAAAEWGAPFTLVALPENRGKGGALAAGFRVLLERGCPWIGARDADGDHLLDDLPHLYRVGELAAAACPGRPVCVTGSRASVHAPLGWTRGECELIVNEVLVEGLAFALALQGRVWDTRFLLGRVPDLQSGYKLYSRAAVEVALHGLAEATAAHPELRLWRTGMEIVPFVSIALAEGVCAEVGRKTYFDQPVTSYGRERFAEFYGAKLSWALRRCGLSAAQALLLLDAAMRRRPLFTDREGRALLRELRRFVHRALGGDEESLAEPRGVALL